MKGASRSDGPLHCCRISRCFELEQLAILAGSTSRQTNRLVVYPTPKELDCQFRLLACLLAIVAREIKSLPIGMPKTTDTPGSEHKDEVE